MATKESQARWVAGHRAEYNAYMRDYYRRTGRRGAPRATRVPLKPSQRLGLAEIRAMRGLGGPPSKVSDSPNGPEVYRNPKHPWLG